MSTASPGSDQTRLRRDGSFIRLWVGQAISAVGDKVSSMAVVVWILTRDDGALALGAVFAVRVLATSALLMVGGTLADRLPARRQTIAAQPPGPGLPWHAPSVQTIDSLTRSGASAAAGRPWCAAVRPATR